MLARQAKPQVSDYASNRVFDGARPISALRLAKLRANYVRTHQTTVHRLVARVGQFLHRLAPKSG